MNPSLCTSKWPITGVNVAASLAPVKARILVLDYGMTEPRFQYLSGDPSLDLVNTVDWTSRGPESERLTSYPCLADFAEGAGVVSKAAAARLLRAAERHPRKGEAALARAREVRALLHDLFRSVAETGRPGAGLEDLNRLLGEAHRHARLEAAAGSGGGVAARWGWHDPEDPDAPLWPIIRRAADLLASPDAAHIKVCGGADCGWLYVDRSRNGLRRWCRMETCGTRAKSRRRAERREAGSGRA